MFRTGSPSTVQFFKWQVLQVKNTLLFPIKLKLTKPTNPRKKNKQAMFPSKKPSQNHKLSPNSTKEQLTKNQAPNQTNKNPDSKMESLLFHQSDGYHTAYRVKSFCSVRSWVVAASGPVPVYRPNMCLNLSYVGVRSLSVILAQWWHTCVSTEMDATTAMYTWRALVLNLAPFNSKLLEVTAGMFQFLNDKVDA